MPNDEPETPKRKYDKGERRHKHVGLTNRPEITFDKKKPKKWVGKCPRNLKPFDNEKLINEAIEGSNGDRELPYAKILYVVHDGAIYEAQTSDGGKSYHGYPYRGKLAKELIDDLRKMAIHKGCEVDFSAWVKTHIEEHGSWR